MSATAVAKFFQAALLDQEIRTVYQSRYANGDGARFHPHEDLPDKVVAA